jgi:hypothetical protein
MAPPSSTDPFTGPLWPGARRLILFIVGIAVILDALISEGANVGQLIVGTILVGVIPVDEFLNRLGRDPVRR